MSPNTSESDFWNDSKGSIIGIKKAILIPSPHNIYIKLDSELESWIKAKKRQINNKSSVKRLKTNFHQWKRLFIFQ